MESRLALLFGNAKYQRINPLRNTVNDAVDMKEKLEKLGFTVLMGLDSTWQQMQDLHKQYLDMLPNYQVGLFFFSGHGSQHNGVNFLIPVDYPGSSTRPHSENEMHWMRNHNFSAEEHLSWISRYESTKVNICILDCCRTDPIQPAVPRVKKAEEEVLLKSRLAPISNQPRGTIISFATGPNNTSSDGRGRNGLYTAELLKWIDRPNLRIEDMFKKVRQNVERVSMGAQITWDHSSLINDFYLNPDNIYNVQREGEACQDASVSTQTVICPHCSAAVEFAGGESRVLCPMCRKPVERGK